MSVDPDAPGFGGLIKGEGKVPARILAWSFALGIVFVLALVCFWALSLTL